MIFLIRAFVVAIICAVLARAETRLPGVIGDHMVLQQQQANPIWGWDIPGTQVTVTFGRQHHRAVAGQDGRWSVQLAAETASATPRVLIVKGTTQRKIQDVLVGEVWVCAGQSNMALPLGEDANGELDAATANLPNLRLYIVPQEPSTASSGGPESGWRASTPATARAISAVGYRFARYVHEAIGVPVGLVDSTWGGSTTETWIPRESLEHDSRFQALMAEAGRKDAEARSEAGRAAYERAVAAWKLACEEAAKEKRPAPGGPPQWLVGGTRPGNLFTRMIGPVLGYGMRGVIWYQGESNVPRAAEHADLFPLLIERWRQAWQQGDFSFYWVQLPKFGSENLVSGNSAWAAFRETQSQALRLPNTGQAVCLDLGEAQNLHPRRKQEISARLARWALARDYGRNLPYRSPVFRSMQVSAGKALLTFDCFGASLSVVDATEIKGFTVCGADRIWYPARARIVGPDKVELESPDVASPVAVRYAWADSPPCTLFSNDYLPVTPFRTDDFDPNGIAVR